jgi:predicted kinase
MPSLILICGPSATGKTTLARRLAADLSLPLFFKDSIKEILFETLPPQETDWSSLLSQASIRVLCYLLESMMAGGSSCIGEANFNTAAVRPMFKAMQERYAFSCVEIMCDADAQVRLQRLRLRNSTGQRHAAHGNSDADITREWQDTQTRLTPIGLNGPCIELDTTNFSEVAYQQLLAEICTTLKRES